MLILTTKYECCLFRDKLLDEIRSVNSGTDFNHNFKHHKNIRKKPSGVISLRK